MGQKFKKTPAGEIPVDWEARELGDLCVNNPEYGANVSAIEFKQGLPRYVRITDINDNGTLISTGVKSIRKEDAKGYQLGDGELIFARSGATVGKTYLYRKSDGSCAFAGYTIRFKPNPSYLLPEFLFQFTHSNFYYQWVKGMLRAGAQPNINGSEYSGLILPVPPIKEQDGIVVILSSIDALVSKISEEIEKTEELKKGLMCQLLTCGIGHKKFKKTLFGKIPVEWCVVPLEQACEKIQDGTHFSPKSKSGPYMYITSKNIRMGRMDVSDVSGISEEEHRAIYKRSDVRKGDVLLTKDGAQAGNIAINTIEGEFSLLSSVAMIRPNLNVVCSEWIYQFYASEKGNKLVLSQIAGQAITRLTLEKIRNLTFVLPPLKEQEKIGEILSTIDQDIEKNNNSLKAITELKKGLMNMLLTGKIRVGGK
jgi:type I restriction enzyme S subunit